VPLPQVVAQDHFVIVSEQFLTRKKIAPVEEGEREIKELMESRNSRAFYPITG